MSTHIAFAIGMAAGCFTTVSFFPQAITLWRHAPKPAPSVSLVMYILMSIGTALWIIYGCMLGAWPITIFNAIAIFVSLSIVMYKIKYK